MESGQRREVLADSSKPSAMPHRGLRIGQNVAIDPSDMGGADRPMRRTIQERAQLNGRRRAPPLPQRVVDRFLSSSRVAAFVPSFRQLSEEVVAALSRGVTVDAVDAIGLPIRVQPARRVPSRAKRRAQPRVWDRSSRLSWPRNREA